jgi:acyl carrier protein
MSEINEQLRSLVIEIAGLPPAFDGAANLYLDLGVPSMKAMQLLMELEERFGVSVPDEDFVDAASLDALTALMKRLTSAKGGAGV